jgi:hypothetical protein
MASRTTHPASAIPKRRRRNLNNGQHGAESSSKSAEASAESNDETDVGGNLDDDASSINGPAATASSYHQHGGSGIGGGALRNRDSFEETSIPFSSSSDSIGSQPHPSSAFAAGLGRKRPNALLPLVGASASLMTSRVDENDGSSVTMESPEGYNSGGHESSGTYDGDISSTAVGGLDRKAGGGHHHHRIGHHTHTESEASMTSAIPGLAPSSKGQSPVLQYCFTMCTALMDERSASGQNTPNLPFGRCRSGRCFLFRLPRFIPDAISDSISTTSTHEDAPLSCLPP